MLYQYKYLYKGMLDSLIFIQNNMMYHYKITDTDCYLRTTHQSSNSQMIFDQEYEKIDKNMEA